MRPRTAFGPRETRSVRLPGRCLATGEPPRWSWLDSRRARECLEVVGGKGLTADAPLAAGDLLDDAPGELAHALALDRDHRVRDPFDDLPLLLGGEDTLDDLDLDERHAALLVGTWSRLIVRSIVSLHIGHTPGHPPRTLRRDRHSTYHRGAHGSVRCRWAGDAARARARGRTCPGGAPRCRAARRRNRRDRGRCRNWQVAAARDGGCTGLRPRVPRAERASDRAGAGVPIRSRPPAVRAPADGGRQCRPRPL